MTKITLTSQKRELFGRKVKRLRKIGLIPANIFGSKVKSHSVSVDSKEFDTVFKKAGETQIIDLDGKSVLVSNLQLDPISNEVIHVDFRQVDLKEKIEAMVPVEVLGDSPAEKQNLGTVVQQIHEIEVEALPSDLPEKVEVDATLLVEVDQAIYVKDLKVSKDVTIKTDGELIVVKVEPPTKEEVAPVVESEVPAATAEDQTSNPSSDEVKTEESN